MSLTWSTQRRKVKDLIPYAPNPRKMTKEQSRQLLASIDKFDYVELIAIQPDNRIIAGHMRVKILKSKGWGNKEIEVRVPDRLLTDDEMKEYLIRSNKNTGEWDWDLLANDFDPEDLFAWGFTPEELTNDILDLSDEEEAEEPEKCAHCGQKLRKKSA